MTKFQKDLLRRQFILRFGAFLSNKLLGRLVPVGVDIKQLLEEDITPHRESDTADIEKHNASRSQSNVSVVRELVTNIFGFVDAFTADELDLIWSECVSTIPVSFADIKASKKAQVKVELKAAAASVHP